MKRARYWEYTRLRNGGECAHGLHILMSAAAEDRNQHSHDMSPDVDFLVCLECCQPPVVTPVRHGLLHFAIREAGARCASGDTPSNTISLELPQIALSRHLQ